MGEEPAAIRADSAAAAAHGRGARRLAAPGARAGEAAGDGTPGEGNSTAKAPGSDRVQSAASGSGPRSDVPGEGVRGAPGRESLFARYVLPELAVLYRVALSLTSQPADAEDLVQETLIRAYRAVDRFDGAHPRAWLLTILRHTHLNRVRVRTPDLLRDGDDAAAADRLLWAAGSAHPSAEDVVVSDLFEHVVAEALAGLPDVHRLVVTLVDVDGLTYAEAAQVLGVPRGTVMSRLHRARARIRGRLVAAGLVPTGRMS